MHRAQRGRAVGEAAAKDVAQGKIDRHALAEKEKGYHDGWKGQIADDEDVADHHGELGEGDGAAAAEAFSKRVDESCAGDEAYSIPDEDEGHYCVPNIVVSIGIISALVASWE